MDVEHQNFHIICKAISLILRETRRPKYLPKWLYNYWQPEANAVFQLKDTIKEIEENIDQSDGLSQQKIKLIKVLDQERYFARVHLNDNKLFGLIQDAMVLVLFFSKEDVYQYNEFVLAKHTPEKFIEYLNTKEAIGMYKEYLKKQQAFYGRFIQNFTDEEITIAAKTQMINGKLLDILHLEEFLKYGFHYVIQELKALSMNHIEKGFLNQERINSYTNKISLIMHPANELQLDPAALIKNSRYILEDIINAAGVTAGVANHPEHQAIINGCYWIDEMFKSAAGGEEFIDNIMA